MRAGCGIGRQLRCGFDSALKLEIETETGGHHPGA
jgi:hypothetical protein